MMKHAFTYVTDIISRRTFLQRSAGVVATYAGASEYARAETENTYGVEPPELRSRAEVEAVLGKTTKPAAEANLRPLTILFAGGTKDHPPKSHSHDVLPKRWKVLLGGAGPEDEAVTNMYRPQVEADLALITSGSPRVKALSTLEWPTEEQFATADVIMLYQHPKCLSDVKHQQQIEAFLNRGGGLLLSHYVLWNASPAVADLLGLAKGKDSKYKHKVVTLKMPEPRHPIMHGLPDTFTLADECFWNLQGDRSKVTALATSDESVGDKISAEPVIWAHEHGKGRVVASTLGHFDWTFDDPFFRTILLRGIAWTAGESPYRFDSLIARGIPLKD
jgi:type 1 glutamine amidotransferase